MRGRVLSTAVLAALLFFSRGARADEQADLDKGRNAYLTRQYDEADARFRAMLDPKSGTLHDLAIVTQAYMYWGAVQVAKSRPKDASALFEQLLLKDPHYEPDPLSFPTEVLDAFTDTRSRIRDRLNAQAEEQAKKDAAKRAREEEERRREVQRIHMLERLASEEKITEHHSRFIAMVPFGAGQFQNGQTALGWVFLGAEAAFVAAGTVAVPFYYSALNDAANTYNSNSATRTKDAQAELDRANTYRVLNLSAYGAFVATAVVGVVQANLKFQSEVVVVRQRTLPALPPGAPARESATPSRGASLVLAPLLRPLATEHGFHGGLFGVEGRF